MNRALANGTLPIQVIAQVARTLHTEWRTAEGKHKVSNKKPEWKLTYRSFTKLVVKSDVPIILPFLLVLTRGLGRDRQGAPNTRYTYRHAPMASYHTPY